MREIKLILDWLEDLEVFRVNRIDVYLDYWFYEKMEDVKLEENMIFK